VDHKPFKVMGWPICSTHTHEHLAVYFVTVVRL